jgi:tryptophan-rich sensory protein
MSHPVIYSLLICAIAAALEGLFAGSGIRQRLLELRLPRYAPPFWGWIVIGVLYYAICFAVLRRLFLSPTSVSRETALGLMGFIMFINALWNYFFFRTKNLRHCFLIGLLYTASAAALVLLLMLQVDRTAAWYLLPYLVYLVYVSVLSYGIWKLNPPG